MDHGKKPINSDKLVYGLKGKLPTVKLLLKKLNLFR